MPKAKKFDDPENEIENPEEEITAEHIFAGADQEDQDNDEITGDRGDDPDFIEPDEDEADGKKADADDADEKADDKADKADESEDEPEADDEAGEVDDDDGDGDGDKKISDHVTKDRFNAVNERMKLAEKQLRDSEAAQRAEEETAKPDPFDYDKKEMEYMELVNDGEYDKANTVRKEIRAAERAEIQAETTAANQDSTARVSEQVDFTNKITELSDEFDAFNPQHKSYDQGLVDEAVARRDMFIDRGMTMADALDKGAREVAKLFDVESKYERMADEEIAKQEAAKKPAKKKADVKKKVSQAAKQPAKMDEGSAINEGEKNALNMDDAEFDSLPESTKARMRGDIL